MENTSKTQSALFVRYDSVRQSNCTWNSCNAEQLHAEYL